VVLVASDAADCAVGRDFVGVGEGGGVYEEVAMNEWLQFWLFVQIMFNGIFISVWIATRVLGCP